MAQGPSILIVGPHWVGDMVMAQCLFSALRQVHPGAAIDVMAPDWAAPLLRRMPEVRDTIGAPFDRGTLDFRRRRASGRALRGRYDLAYVMQGSWKSALVPFFAGIPRRIGFLKEMRFGLLNDIVPLPKALKRRTAKAFFQLAQGGEFRSPRLDVDPGNQAALLERLGLQGQRYVAMMPGAEFGPAKRWPSAQYAALSRELIADGLRVVLLGSSNDRPVTKEIAALAPGTLDLAGETRLEDAVDLLAAATVAISNDSGLMHVAAAVGAPVVGVYGSTSPENTPPLTELKRLVWLHLSCSPCHQKICPLGHMNCLNTLGPELVSAAARDLNRGVPG